MLRTRLSLPGEAAGRIITQDSCLAITSTEPGPEPGPGSEPNPNPNRNPRVGPPASSTQYPPGALQGLGATQLSGDGTEGLGGFRGSGYGTPEEADAARVQGVVRGQMARGEVA